MSIIPSNSYPVQLGLVGGNTTRYLYDERGILAQQTPTGDWQYVARDDLWSVRSVVNDDLSVGSAKSYAPFGTPLEPGVFGSRLNADSTSPLSNCCRTHYNRGL
jgi:hypothetical protein